MSGLGLAKRRKSPVFPDIGERVYPNYFAPVVVARDGKRAIEPIRYCLRPRSSESEIPSKYNVFNARLDSIGTRRTWQGLFRRQYALFPFIKFYEWVSREGKKVEVSFSPNDREIMWAPALCDTWVFKDGAIELSSFALIATDPPQKIEEAGHDRCPIFLKSEHIDEWLQPSNNRSNRYAKLLAEQEDVVFKCEG